MLFSFLFLTHFSKNPPQVFKTCFVMILLRSKEILNWTKWRSPAMFFFQLLSWPQTTGPATRQKREFKKGSRFLPFISSDSHLSNISFANFSFDLYLFRVFCWGQRLPRKMSLFTSKWCILPLCELQIKDWRWFPLLSPLPANH